MLVNSPAVLAALLTLLHGWLTPVSSFETTLPSHGPPACDPDQHHPVTATKSYRLSAHRRHSTLANCQVASASCRLPWAHCWRARAAYSCAINGLLFMALTPYPLFTNTGPIPCVPCQLTFVPCQLTFNL